MQNFNNHQVIQSSSQAPLIALGERLRQLRYHWPIFIIGMLLTVGCGYIYLNLTPQKYEVQASINLEPLRDLSLTSNPSTEPDRSNDKSFVEDEIAVLTSQLLVSKVIQDLNLNVSYKLDKPFLGQDLGIDSPLLMEVLDQEEQKKAIAFTVSPGDDSSYMILLPDGREEKLPYNQIVKTDFGQWKITRNNKIPLNREDRIKITIQSIDKVAFDYRKRLEVNPAKPSSHIVNLYIQDSQPSRAKLFLTHLTSEYAAHIEASRSGQIKSSLGFLNGRIAELSGDLQKIQTSAVNLKSHDMLTGAGLDPKATFEALQNTELKANEVNLHLSIIEKIEEYLNSDKSVEKLPSSFGLNDEILSGLISKLSLLQIERNKLGLTTPKTSVEFQDIENQILSLQSAIRGNLGSMKQVLLNSRKNLDLLQKRLQLSVKAMPTSERSYNEVKRQAERKEELFNHLLKKKDELALASVSGPSAGIIIDKPYAGSPIGPNPLVVFAISIIFGILFPTGYIVGRDIFNNTVQNSKQLSHLINVPIIAELEDTYIGKESIISPDQGRINEQLRYLTIKLNRAAKLKNNGNITIVASGSPKEGKSFVCSNLGIELAKLGNRTLIIDLDLRRPRMNAIFNLPANSSGLNDYLYNGSSINRVIQKSGIHDKLDILACQPDPSGVTQLFYGRKFEELIEYLRSHYDHILIDSPPTSLFSDTLMLSQTADTILYVVRNGFTSSLSLTSFHDQLDQNLLDRTYLVLNGVNSLKYGGANDYGNYYSGVAERKLLSRQGWRDLKKRF